MPFCGVNQMPQTHDGSSPLVFVLLMVVLREGSRRELRELLPLCEEGGRNLQLWRRKR